MSLCYCWSQNNVNLKLFAANIWQQINLIFVMIIDTINIENMKENCWNWMCVIHSPSRSMVLIPWKKTWTYAFGFWGHMEPQNPFLTKVWSSLHCEGNTRFLSEMSCGGPYGPRIKILLVETTGLNPSWLIISLIIVSAFLAEGYFK